MEILDKVWHVTNTTLKSLMARSLRNTVNSGDDWDASSQLLHIVSMTLLVIERAFRPLAHPRSAMASVFGIYDTYSSTAELTSRAELEILKRRGIDTLKFLGGTHALKNKNICILKTIQPINIQVKEKIKKIWGAYAPSREHVALLMSICFDLLAAYF